MGPDDVEGCIGCDLVAGRRALPGGVIHETAHWLVEHCIGPLGLGTLVVKPRRHLVHVADLTDAEAAEMGPLLRRAAQIVTELMRPEQVYVSLWSHAGGVPAHIHHVVQPVTRPVMDLLGSRGPKLQADMFRANVSPALEDVERIAARARDLFASGTGSAAATSEEA